MGEAKRKMEEGRAIAIREAKAFSRPVSPLEKSIVEYISTAERRLVRRVPEHAIAYMRMKPLECHTNCYYYEKKAKDENIKMVTGWIDMGGLLTLHSVIEIHGELWCITPLPMGQTADDFPLVPDPAISLSLKTGGMFWNDEELVEHPAVIRLFPEATIPLAKQFHSKLLLGADIYRALEEFRQAVMEVNIQHGGSESCVVEGKPSRVNWDNCPRD